MPLSLTDQLDLATTSWATGDLDLLSKMLTSPDAVTLAEQRTTAEKLGIKGGFLSAIVNIGTDPTVWIAMLMARSFPTAQFLKGVIPQRFIGSANEFTGLSSVARTVEGFFRGTNISKLTGLKMMREAEVLKVGNSLFDDILTRPNWKEEMPLVSQLLEGQSPQGATPGMHALAGRIRGHMNELWGFLAKTQKVSGGFDSSQGITRASAQPFAVGEAPRYLRDYLPHIPLLGEESVMTISGREALRKMGTSKVGQAIGLAGENPARVWSPLESDRLSSNFERYQTFMDRVGSQVFNPRLFHRQRMGLSLQSGEGSGLFVTDLNLILQKYIHSVARTYALNAPLTLKERSIARTLIEGKDGLIKTIRPTSEPIMVQLINEGLDAAGPVRIMQRPVAGTQVVQSLVDPSSLNPPTLGALKTLVREVKGVAGQDEILFGNLFNAVRRTSARFSAALGRKGATSLEDAIDTASRGYKNRKMTNQITSYFYATTLGLNTSSSLKNLFQPFLTTAPSLGIGPTLAGYKVLKQRLPQYASEVVRQGRLLKQNPHIPLASRANLSVERAFHKTFPELAETGIKADPRAFELPEANLITDSISGRTQFKSMDAYWKFMLQPFTHAEMSNQVVTFYGGKAALRNAIRTGEMEIPLAAGSTAPLAGRAVEDFLNLEAAALVNATQFRPGPGSRTVLQSIIPAPFRMFTSFPVRLANFFAESTVRGALTEAQLREANLLTRITGGRNLGTLARTYAIGKAAVTGLRDTVGVDMADAMGVTGPFTNIVQSGRMFAPLPVSPLPSVVFGTLSYASTRDVKDMQPMTLPVVGNKLPIPKLLVPGGIQLSRMVKAAQSYRPDLGGFVDDDERLMYQGDTTDMVMGMLGIPLEKNRRLREQMDRVGANRLRIRKYRRAYAVAARNYDMQEMGKLESDFAEEFPEMGNLAIGRQDLRRYNEQARMTGVQRMLRSLGNKMKYLEADIYEHDPDLIGEYSP